MRKIAMPVFLFAMLLTAAAAQSADTWVEGKNYFPIQPAQPTNVAPGKIEVVEVFSYGCPACNLFYPVWDKLKAGLPKNAEVAYIHAAFNTAEDWPMFQRAFITAQAMGVAEKAHDAMFSAVWSSDELAVTDRKTNRLKNPLPSIENAAAFYARVTGVKKEEFLSISKSFSVDAKIRNSEALMRAYHVDSTPTIIVNGKYRVTPQSAGGDTQVVELVKWLVAKETK